MSRSAGPGSPIFFVCPVARSNRIGTWGDGEIPRYPDGHGIALTGRTKARSPRGVLGVRSTYVAREYRCECGHVGWSTHKDLEKATIPLASDEE